MCFTQIHQHSPTPHDTIPTHQYSPYLIPKVYQLINKKNQSKGEAGCSGQQGLKQTPPLQTSPHLALPTNKRGSLSKGFKTFPRCWPPLLSCVFSFVCSTKYTSSQPIREIEEHFNNEMFQKEKTEKKQKLAENPSLFGSSPQDATPIPSLIFLQHSLLVKLYHATRSFTI